MNSHFPEVIRKGIIALLIRVMGFLAGYLFIYLTVRFFGAETQGRLSISFSFMIIGSLLSRYGLDVHFVKVFAIPDNTESAKGIYNLTLPYSLVTSTIYAIIVYVFSGYIAESIFDDPGLELFLKWTSPTIILFTLVLINANVLRGLKYNAIYSFLFNGGRFLFALIVLGAMLLFTTSNAEDVVIAHTLSVLILAILSIFYISKYLGNTTARTDLKPRPFIKESLPMLFSASMIVLLGWSDTLILGYYESSEVVGVYSVVLKIAIVTSFTFQAIDSILAPKLSSAFHGGEMEAFNKLVNYFTVVNVVLSLIVVTGLILFKDLILSVFGPEFQLGSTALIILCIGQLFNAIGGPVGSILQMTGHQKVFQNILFVALIINIILNLVLVQPMGINGVAIATATSLSFWNIAGVWYIRTKIM